MIESDAMRRVVSLLVLWPLLVSTAFAQSGQTGGTNEIDYETARLSRIAQALAIEQPIELDGRLDEEAWQRAEPIENFVQWGNSWDPGGPPSQPTEVRILYDDTNLYVGAICWEEDVANMIVNGLKRDFQSNQGDELGFLLDTLNDDRSGFFFSTNPAGARRDLQVANDSQINQEWDGVWDVRVRVEEDRWVAEFVVPFTTLRFAGSESQEWGLNIYRKIRRLNEEANWSPIPRRYRMNKVSLAGTLQGVEGVRQGRNIKVKPYGVAGLVQQRAGDTLENEFDYDGGFDAKIGVTQSLTLDATYRTDFSQTEVDQDQVNLTRFSLFFPEKREFFLENSGVFGFGGRNASAQGRGGGSNLIPFFSRRIGLSGGEPVPIVGGTRLSGSAGAYEIGLLAMKTESVDPESDEDTGVPSDNFIVGRLKRNLLQNSFIGAIFTNRDSTVAGDYNRVFGVDAVFQFFNRLDVSGYVLRSQTPAVDENQDAHKVSIGWRDNTFAFGANYEKVGDNFNPEIGFVRRSDMSHYSGNFSYTPLIEGSDQIRNLTLRTNYDFYEGVSGEIETRDYGMNFGVNFTNGAVLNFNAGETFERDEFNRYEVAFGDYKFRDYSVSYNSDRSRVIGGRINYSWGDFWSGTKRSIGGDVTLKPNYHWQIDTRFSRNDIKMPVGNFVTTLVSLKVLYAFTSRIFLNTFLQYNAERNDFSSNIRFNIIHHPLSDIYVVFNERRDTLTGEVLDRGIIFKFTNLFNF